MKRFRNPPTETQVNIIKTASGKTARIISGWTPLPQDRTTIEGTSMTVPNMSYEIKDLLTNYTRGIDLIGPTPEPTYDDNPTHDDLDTSAINRMDIFDQAQVIGDTITQSRKLAAQIKAKQQALAQPLASSKVDTTTTTDQKPKT